MAENVGMMGVGWEGITSFAKSAEKTKAYLDELQKTWIYWLDESGRGGLTKGIANDLANHIRSDLLSQKYIKATPTLTPIWIRMKTEMGFDTERKGIASGDLVNSIKAISSGKGLYKVGIPGNIKAKHGNFTYVAQYARRLEFGSGYHGRRGKDDKIYYQPPRPWFAPSFMDYANNNFPKEVRKTLVNRMEPTLKKLRKEMRLSMAMPENIEEELIAVDRVKKKRTAKQVQPWMKEGRSEGARRAAAEEAGTGTTPEYGQVSMQPGGESYGKGDIEEVSRAARKEAPGFSERQRTTPYEERGGSFVTTAGYDEYPRIWNQQDEMWQDAMEYFEQTGVFPDI